MNRSATSSSGHDVAGSSDLALEDSLAAGGHHRSGSEVTISKALGNHLYRVRTSRRIALHHAANLSGLGRVTIGRIEKGRDVTVPELLALCKAYRVEWQTAIANAMFFSTEA